MTRTTQIGPIAGSDGWRWQSWGDDDQKGDVLAALDMLHEVIPGYDEAADVVDQIDDVKDLVEDPTLGVQNTLARDELVAVLDSVRARYSDMAFPSTIITELIGGDFVTPSDLAVATGSRRLFLQPGSAHAGYVHVVGALSLEQEPDRSLPTGTGESQRLVVPPGRTELYLASRRAVSSTYTIALERIVEDGAALSAGSRDVLTGAGSGVLARALYASAPSALSPTVKNDTAWIAIDNAGSGSVKSVVGLANLSTATISTVGVLGRVYRALEPAPEGGERLYAAHSGGIDAIRTQTTGQPTVSNALTYPSGFGTPVAMDGGTTDGSSDRLFVVSASTMAVYEPSLGTPLVGTVTLAGNAVAVALSTDGRFALVTRHPAGTTQGDVISSMSVYDADTLSLVWERATSRCLTSTCSPPSPVPMAVGVDASHAFVTDPANEVVGYVYLDPPHPTFDPAALPTVVAATMDDAFAAIQDKESMVETAGAVRDLLVLGLVATDEEGRRALMRQAADRIYEVIGGVDGCFGGDEAADVVTVCAEARPIWVVANDLISAISGNLVEPPEETE